MIRYSHRVAPRSLRWMLAATLAWAMPWSGAALAQGDVLNAPQRSAPPQQQQQQQQQRQQQQQQQQQRPAAAPAPQRVAPATPAAPAAPAQQASAVPGVDGWVHECPQSQPCRIFRRVMRADGQGQLAMLSVLRDVRDQRRLAASVLLPLGIGVREAVPLLVDDRYLASIPIETCLPMGCTLSIAMPAELVEVLRRGSVMRFLVLSLDGQTVPINLPIDGIADALRRITG
ncbi:invasion associated locus B family protein [Falsiroseomonas sp.]|uniref:invasion associated locus B family protein n=1 Tax=Falsiroseomonas sp. TaxID=2870721 RepID=UPI003F720711